MRDGDGPAVLVSAKFTIKLDKVTIYVLANGELLPGKRVTGERDWPTPERWIPNR
jgi:hypothetical protein